MKFHYSEDDGERIYPKVDLFIVSMAAAVQPAINPNIMYMPKVDNFKMPIACGMRAYVDSEVMIGTVDQLVAEFRNKLEAAVYKYKHN